MVRVAILGQGMVATHLVVGLERIKQGELEPYGVPLANYDVACRIEDIEVVASYDVDVKKVGKTVYDIAKESLSKNGIPIPETLKDIVVKKGIHLGSLKNLPFKAEGLDDKMSVADAINQLIDDWKSLNVEVVLDVITTEHGEPFNDAAKLEVAISNDQRDKLTAGAAYAYALAKYAKENGKAAFINATPAPLANDLAFVQHYSSNGALLLGDDGASGATPLTADLLEHLAERNRRVLSVVQFNIGGNTDFLALAIPERNVMKEVTKSCIVKDILGYDVPSFIKPTGYLEPLGDKKFVSMHIEYLTFNGLRDEMFINVRLNDSPALAGKLVDVIRLAKMALDKDCRGTLYEVNAFFMKKPGPPGSKAVAKILAFQNLLKWLKSNGLLKQ